MWPLYYAGMYLFVLGIRISSSWNEKSRLWIEGRKNWKNKLQSIPAKKGSRVWVHVSSLGEFEQAKAVIEKLKASRPSIEIFLSFFSPSGFTIKKDYPKAAAVIYLPADLPGNASHFLSVLQPDLAVFVKYDLWPGFIRQLIKRNIPAVLISANWEPGRKRRSWNAPLIKGLLKKFDRIFFQQPDHIDFFRQLGFENISLAGDSRIDRSLQLPVESMDRIPFALHDAGTFDLVAGSTWEEDERILLNVINTLNLKTIIAPHDVSPQNINRLRNKIGEKLQLLSEMKQLEKGTRVIIVDGIGLLSSLYSRGRIAYVGGGFGKGIHNLLEPMAHGKPVLFGPRHKKFPEAIAAISQGAGFVVRNKEELIEKIQFLNQDQQAEQSGMKSRAYLEKNAGASDIIANYILDSIPFRPK